MEWMTSLSPTVLTAIGLVITLAVIVATAREIARKRVAEDRLYRLLEHKMQQSLRVRRQLRDAHRDEMALIRLYEAQIEEALKAMSATDRARILEALHQPSERGRENYVRKILEGTADSSRGAATPV